MRGTKAHRREGTKGKTPAGYSFPEVLFAVVVLGIGFIMIAAIFPVAISQSKATMDETTAAALVRDAVNTISQVARDNSAAAAGIQAMPATGTNPTGGTQTPTFPGQVSSFATQAGWLATRGSLISRDNPRFAFVPLYRRSGNPAIPVANQPPPQPSPADNVQLYVILVQCRALQRVPGSAPMANSPVNVPARAELAFDKYDVGLDITPGNTIVNPNNLCAHQVQIQLTDGGAGPDIMQVNATRAAGGVNENLPDAIAEGAYIVVADQRNAATRGRIYRVGVVKDQAATAPVPVPGGAGNMNYPIEWELQPGSDLRDNTENLPANTNAWVVGRERMPDGSFTGPAQDVGFYTTIISATK